MGSKKSTRENITKAYYRGKNIINSNTQQPEKTQDFKKFSLWFAYLQKHTAATRIS